jgi:uncharacterized membrane protein HdeD (DUF308 family)
MVQEQEYSNGRRAFDVVVGVIMIIFSAIVLASPRFTAVTLALFFSIGLLALGVGMIGIGIAAARRLPNWLRAFDIASGVIAIVGSVIFLAYPAVAIVSTIILLSIGLLFRGIWGILAGATIKDFPTWYRAMLVGIGILTLVASGIVISSPAVGFLTIMFVLSFSLLINGIENIISGVNGRRLPRYYGPSLKVER